MSSNGCAFCGKEIDRSARYHKSRKYCSTECRRKRKTQYEPISSLFNIPTGTVGAISELEISIELAVKGWHVFRAISPSSPCDLIITKNGNTRRVEVTTGYRLKTGKLFWGKKANPEKFDILAVWIGKEKKAFYFPDV